MPAWKDGCGDISAVSMASGERCSSSRDRTQWGPWFRPTKCADATPAAAVDVNNCCSVTAEKAVEKTAERATKKTVQAEEAANMQSTAAAVEEGASSSSRGSSEIKASEKAVEAAFAHRQPQKEA